MMLEEKVIFYFSKLIVNSLPYTNNYDTST
ncbi:hypothetical protein SAMN05421593_0104 [Chryseobacterium culicis]|uniref:Uncharacterized protein n=1 Tax=Chryseobacterium culicis TaxID=680127 RepID=A0A1H6IJK5_CHRCI|nr:hypothetical protein SAMN05421593_0104 [Chryseobacterium culicis]